MHPVRAVDGRHDLGDLARAEQRLVEGHRLRSTIGAVADDVDDPVPPSGTARLDRRRSRFPDDGGDRSSARASHLGNGAMATLVATRDRASTISRAASTTPLRRRASWRSPGDPIGVNTWVAPIARRGGGSRRQRRPRPLDGRAGCPGGRRRPATAGRSACWRGRVALVDETAEAEHAYRRSIALLTPTPARADLARSHLVYGEWLRRRKRGPMPASHLRSAHSMFVEMGAAPFAERARSDCWRRASGRARPHGDAAPVLTPQEDQVARLAADGMTNAEIGSRLYISAKTVDYHLGKIYRKLGIDSRRQFARRDVLRSEMSARDPSPPDILVSDGSVRMVRSIRSGRRGRVPRVPGWRRRPGRARRRRSSSPGRLLVEGDPTDRERGHRQQREQHGETPDRDAAHHELVDAVADGVGEHADEQAQRRAASAMPRPARSTARRPGVITSDPIASPTPEPGDAAIELRDLRADHDVHGPHRRGQQDEQQPERVAVDLTLAEHDDTTDGEQAGRRRCGRTWSPPRRRRSDR